VGSSEIHLSDVCPDRSEQMARQKEISEHVSATFDRGHMVRSFKSIAANEATGFELGNCLSDNKLHQIPSNIGRRRVAV